MGLCNIWHAFTSLRGQTVNVALILILCYAPAIGQRTFSNERLLVKILHGHRVDVA